MDLEVHSPLSEGSSSNPSELLDVPTYRQLHTLQRLVSTSVGAYLANSFAGETLVAVFAEAERELLIWAGADKALRDRFTRSASLFGVLQGALPATPAALSADDFDRLARAIAVLESLCDTVGEQAFGVRPGGAFIRIQ